jgi:antitoxin component of MazEF toxin-antitoxin module
MYNWDLCISISEEYSFDNSIFLPPSILDYCTKKKKSFPLFFQLNSDYKVSYHSVKEFTAEEEYVTLPKNLAEELHLVQNQIVNISLQWNIPFAKYLLLEPLEEGFFEQNDIDKILESELSKLAVIYPNQILHISNMSGIFSILIKDIQPDWNKVKLESFKDRCYNIIEQNVEVEISNTFWAKKYKQEQEDKLRQDLERIKMQKEDFNYYIKPKPIHPSVDELRELRKKRYCSKK